MHKLLLSVFLISTSGLLAQEQHSAITPEPRAGGWMKRHESFNKKAQENQNNIDLIFVGDSITQGWEGKGREVWAGYYGNRKALNLGIGGDRTQHVLWRLDNGNVKGISPKVAVVMIGTNNSGDNRNSAGEIVDGVRAVVTKLREKVPTANILLLGIFPRGEKFNAQRGKILQVNQALRRLHDGKSVHFLDIGHEFMKDDGTIPKEIMPDFLHFTPKGYQIWAESIEPKLAELLGAKPKAVAAPAPEGPDPSGDWTWSMAGPDGQDVKAKLVLKVDGEKLSGTFEFGGDRVLKIDDGKVKGNELTFVVKRNRPDGGEMVYQMGATVDGKKMEGKATTKFGENEVTQPWAAVRR